MNHVAVTENIRSYGSQSTLTPTTRSNDMRVTWTTQGLPAAAGVPYNFPSMQQPQRISIPTGVKFNIPATDTHVYHPVVQPLPTKSTINHLHAADISQSLASEINDITHPITLENIPPTNTNRNYSKSFETGLNQRLDQNFELFQQATAKYQPQSLGPDGDIVMAEGDPYVSKQVYRAMPLIASTDNVSNQSFQQPAAHVLFGQQHGAFNSSTAGNASVQAGTQQIGSYGQNIPIGASRNVPLIRSTFVASQHQSQPHPLQSQQLQSQQSHQLEQSRSHQLLTDQFQSQQRQQGQNRIYENINKIQKVNEKTPADISTSTSSSSSTEQGRTGEPHEQFSSSRYSPDAEAVSGGSIPFKSTTSTVSSLSKYVADLPTAAERRYVDQVLSRSTKISPHQQPYIGSHHERRRRQRQQQRSDYAADLVNRYGGSRAVAQCPGARHYHDDGEDIIYEKYDKIVPRSSRGFVRFKLGHDYDETVNQPGDEGNVIGGSSSSRIMKPIEKAASANYTLFEDPSATTTAGFHDMSGVYHSGQPGTVEATANQPVRITCMPIFLKNEREADDHDSHVGYGMRRTVKIFSPVDMPQYCPQTNQAMVPPMNVGQPLPLMPTHTQPPPFGQQQQQQSTYGQPPATPGQQQQQSIYRQPLVKPGQQQHSLFSSGTFDPTNPPMMNGQLMQAPQASSNNFINALRKRINLMA